MSGTLAHRVLASLPWNAVRAIGPSRERFAGIIVAIPGFEDPTMLTIHHAPNTRSIRVRWLCEELGIPHAVNTIEFAGPYRASPEWRALNPVGKVPAMTDGAFSMFESGAMVQHLLDRHGDGRLQPPRGTEAHGRYLQWSWFAEATYARPLGEIINHRRAFGESGQMPAVVAEMAGRARLCSEVVDRELRGRDYLVGDEFSAADIMMGYSVFLARMLMPLDGLDALQAYWERLSARPAFVRATAD